MCGVMGVLAHGRAVSAGDEARVRHGLERLAHRGPDQDGLCTLDGQAILGHRRLSLLDLSAAGGQPMTDPSGRYTLVYNGEVYNFRELARELEREDAVPWRSGTDTEVLLRHLVRHAGDLPGALREWEGMFAFALYDRLERSLFLACDRFGIKPLLYAARPDGFWFASELKGLLDVVEGRLDAFSLLQHLATGFLDTTHFTLLEGVEHLVPGAWLRVQADGRRETGQFHRHSEWLDPALYREYGRWPFRDVVDEFGRLFTEAVHRTLIADAPLATLNSGGVDSSLVSAVARAHSPRIRLYHAHVVGERTSELAAARRLAEHVKGELRVREMNDAQWLRGVVRTVYHYEAPAAYHPNSVPFMLLCELIREDGVKGILTGEGADEVFLGYPRLVLYPYLEAVRGAAARVAGSLGLGAPAGAGGLAARLRSRCLPEEEEADLDASCAFLGPGRERVYCQRSLRYLRYHLFSVLHRNDRMGMAHSIESRFPFLYAPLVRFGMNLPVRHRIRLEPRVVNPAHPFLVDKAPVRHFAARTIPPAIAFRRKLGFPTFQQERVRFGAAFFRGGFVEDQFELDEARLTRLLEGLAGFDRSMLFFLEIWGRLYVRRHPLGEVEGHVAATCWLPS